MPRSSSLPKSSSELILKLLRKKAVPMSAYEILEALRKHGIKSPPIVYRALDSLRERGAVHKINELNNFIACDCDDDHQHSFSVLTVCQGCREVTEIHDHKVIDQFNKIKKSGIALANQAVIELPIFCEKCVRQ